MVSFAIMVMLVDFPIIASRTSSTAASFVEASCSAFRTVFPENFLEVALSEEAIPRRIWLKRGSEAYQGNGRPGSSLKPVVVCR